MEELKENGETRRAFRALLQAMSHPGQVYSLPGDGTEDEDVARAEGWMVVLRTLLDHEVSFGIAGGHAESLERAVVRLTGCPRVAVEGADFVVVPEGDSKGEILKARRGTLEYPDAGATAIYVVQSLERDGAGTHAGENPSSVLPEAPVSTPVSMAAAVLRGPGIEGEISVSIAGTTPRELADIKTMTEDYPLGIDCIFVDGAGRVMCIPRSTRIEAI